MTNTVLSLAAVEKKGPKRSSIPARGFQTDHRDLVLSLGVQALAGVGEDAELQPTLISQ